MNIVNAFEERNERRREARQRHYLEMVAIDRWFDTLPLEGPQTSAEVRSLERLREEDREAQRRSFPLEPTRY